MMRLVRRCRLLAIAGGATAWMAGSAASAQVSQVAPTTVGLAQPVLQGVLVPPIMSVTRVSGSTVTATSTANIRSNIGWRLLVTLTAPVATNLTAKVEVGRNKAITLTPTSPSAVVSSGDLPCALCPVVMTWSFAYRTSGRNAPAPVAAPITYAVIPLAGVAAAGSPLTTAEAPAPAKDEQEPALPTAPSSPTTTGTGTGTTPGTGTGAPTTPTTTPTTTPSVPANPRGTPTTTPTPTPTTKPSTGRVRIP